MATLLEIQKDTEGLSIEEKSGLITHLLSSLPSPQLDSRDEEANQRDLEMDSGTIDLVSHEELVKSVRG
tara:strand:- start:5280 stop:5486 length:207 start_codon:yes stop_codon:yes gene_type:complete